MKPTNCSGAITESRGFIRKFNNMKVYSLLIATVLIVGCIAPRLGLKTIKYDDVERPQTQKNLEMKIFSDRADIPYQFKVIGLVRAAPPRAERDFGHEPIIYLKKQAREIGGKALLNLKSEESYIWTAEVIVPTN